MRRTVRRAHTTVRLSIRRCRGEIHRTRRFCETCINQCLGLIHDKSLHGGAVGILACLAGRRPRAKTRGDSASRTLKNPVPATARRCARWQSRVRQALQSLPWSEWRRRWPLCAEGPSPPDLTDAKWDRGSSEADIFCDLERALRGRQDEALKANGGRKDVGTSSTTGEASRRSRRAVTGAPAVRVGRVARCLCGQEVRYDGGHKRDRS